ncbi:hypothetical protein E2C01_033099 [Portunus trituberculatus]|uniref:Uncharacterized protein n=1 Tax=Portunus trituberculatus TaxID=210409 RepID=A0A5B7F2V3_PORTR|nr:hypothetical protein [Portunus trituberculatus]
MRPSTEGVKKAGNSITSHSCMIHVRVQNVHLWNEANPSSGSICVQLLRAETLEEISEHEY